LAMGTCSMFVSRHRGWRSAYNCTINSPKSRVKASPVIQKKKTTYQRRSAVVISCRNARTLTGQQLESCHDGQHTQPCFDTFAHDIGSSEVFLVLVVHAPIPFDDVLKHFEQISEEFDVNEMRELGDTLHSGRKQRRPLWLLQDGEVQHKKVLERLSLLEI
jgi:N-acetylglutamate synthase/N-acetylornithine aminotransferase